MRQSELLEHLVEALERLQVDYLITGSTATIYYGEPRFTNDIDVVVRLRDHHVRRLADAFPATDFYFSAESARRALTSGGQFNVIHPRSGLKIDFVVAEASPFDRSRFTRGRRLRPAAHYEAVFASPEDVILKKLVFHREGGSDKHLRDIAGVLKISGDEIDFDYLDRWAERLGVADLWRRVRERAGR
jgi:hypothetical protein